MPGGCPSIGQVVPGVKAARARSAASTWKVGRRMSILPHLHACGSVRGSAPSGGNREALSTDAACAGGPARSSAEPPVMGGERRGRVIYGLFARETGGVSPDGGDLSRRLLWVPAPAFSVGRGRDLSASMPEEELGPGP